jgi:hypothetical protein
VTEKKKAGRKPTDPATHRRRLVVTISPEALALLDQLATRWGDSKSGTVERMIRQVAWQEQFPPAVKQEPPR